MIGFRPNQLGFGLGDGSFGEQQHGQQQHKDNDADAGVNERQIPNDGLEGHIIQAMI